MKKPVSVAARIFTALAVLWATTWVASADWSKAHRATGAGIVTARAGETVPAPFAVGWSVQRSLMGKTILNESGLEIGKVEDLIVARDRKVAYVIVGTGGFLGLGGHDVAIPIEQIEGRGQGIVMPGASQTLLDALPAFAYADEPLLADRSLASAQADPSTDRALPADFD
jgi:sporulation protein YlmC with PRC-barrel domain